MCFDQMLCHQVHAFTLSCMQKRHRLRLVTECKARNVRLIQIIINLFNQRFVMKSFRYKNDTVQFRLAYKRIDIFKRIHIIILLQFNLRIENTGKTYHIQSEFLRLLVNTTQKLIIQWINDFWHNQSDFSGGTHDSLLIWQKIPKNFISFMIIAYFSSVCKIHSQKQTIPCFMMV